MVIKLNCSKCIPQKRSVSSYDSGRTIILKIKNTVKNHDLKKLQIKKTLIV